jgi:Protein of unknown function (DUF3987)
MQRLQLLVYPDAQPWSGADQRPDVEEPFALFEQLANLDPVERGAVPAGDGFALPYFVFDDEGQRVFDRFCGESLNDDDGPIGEHLRGYRTLFAKLALLMHLADGASGSVTVESAQRALVWCGYLEAHARRCYGLGGIAAAAE